MAETTDFVSRIKVRDLISAYENKNSADAVEYSRPRAKSVGNVLAHNVIVQLSEFNTFDDIENALRKIEANLNFYEVYNKAKHVAFQEQLFNILTSIVNIESDAKDAATRRKRLISKTQTLVSFLNQKLPSNISTVIASEVSQHKYTPYSSYIKENGASEVSSKSTSDAARYKPAPQSGSTKNVEVSDWSDTLPVSVKKLKQHFLPPPGEVASDPPPKSKTKKTEAQVSDKATKSVSNGFKPEQPKEETVSIEEPPRENEQTGNVSVVKLRSLFEQKSVESPKGLEIATDPAAKDLGKSLFEGLTSNNFPYTDRNLGNLRLKRSVSGSYMNYSGLLNRIDINRTKSVNEINEVGTKGGGKTFNNVQAVDSGTESDTEDADEDQTQVDEYRRGYSTPRLGYVGKETERIKIQGEEHHEFESAKIISDEYSVTNIGESKQEHTVQEIIAAIEGTGEVTNSTAESKDITTHENVVTGVEEVVVNYATASTDNSKQDSSQIFTNVDEERVSFSEAESKQILDIEDTADIKGIEEVDVKYSTSVLSDTRNQADHTTNEDSVATIAGVEEMDVNYSTAESKNVVGDEKTASLQGVETSDITYTKTTSDVPNHEVHTIEIQEDFRNSSTTNGTDDSNANDVSRKITIEEELNKIDVDPKLANEDISMDISLNADDLKNADDEFEKLLQSTEAQKVST